MKTLALSASLTSTDPIARLLSAFFAGRGPHTLDAYQRDLQDFCVFVGPLLGAKGASQGERNTAALRSFLKQRPGVVNELVMHYQAHLLTVRKLAPSSTARHLAVLRSLAKTARMLGLITWNIDVKAVTVDRLTRATRGPGIDGIRALLETAERQPSPLDRRDVAMIRLMADLGLRIGEIARLDLSDVDPQTGSLWILGKGRRAKERLQMPKESRLALTRWLCVRDDTGPALFISLSPHRARDHRLTTRGLYHIIRDLGATIGLHVRPHGLRHTAITTAIEAAAANGVSLDTVCQFSRHKSITTLLVYRDQVENKQGQFAEWVSAEVSKEPPT